MAHNLYAHLEIDFGRAQDAMTRLLERAQVRTADPELFAGLVHACRYCGLLDASRAADEQARRLDKLIRTSVIHTHFMLGDYQRAHEVGAGEPDLGGYLNALALVMLGREQEAVAKLRKVEEMGDVTAPRKFTESLRMLLEGNRAEGLAATRTILAPGFRDPEVRVRMWPGSSPISATRPPHWPSSLAPSRKATSPSPRWPAIPGSTRSAPIRHSQRSCAMPKRAIVRRSPPSCKPMAIGCLA